MKISTADRAESYARSLRVRFIKNFAFGRESATSASEVHPSGAHTFLYAEKIQSSYSAVE